MKKQNNEDTPYMNTYNKAPATSGIRFPGAPYTLNMGTSPTPAVQYVTEEEPKKTKKDRKKV